MGEGLTDKTPQREFVIARNRLREVLKHGDMKYQPVSYDPMKSLESDLQNPDFRKAYEALEDEFAALDALLAARRQAGMTQEQVAAKMGVRSPRWRESRHRLVLIGIPRHWRCCESMLPLLTANLKSNLCL